MRFLLLLVFVPLTLLAQQNRPAGKGWKELTISDGLSQGMIFDIKQDQKGFIWIATKDGLNRYDGYNFKVFSQDPYNEFSISDNACSALLIDRHERLWVGTLTNGLNLFDARTQRFYHLNISDRAASGAGNYEIRQLAEDPDGNIWVSTDKNQLFRITLPAHLKTGFPDSSNFTRQVRIKQLSFPGKEINIHHFVFTSNGEAILGMSDGMSLLNWRQPIRLKPVNRVMHRGIAIESINDDAVPGYWFSATQDGVFAWHNGTVKTRWFSSKHTASLMIKCLNDSTVAIATVDYLWVMSTSEFMQGDSLTSRNAFATMPPNLFGIRALLKDQTGVIWVGTSGYGLRLFNPKIKLFNTYLPNLSLSYLFQDREGRTYVRQQYTYSRVELATGQMIPIDPKRTKNIVQRFLMQDHQHNFWLTNGGPEPDQFFIQKFSSDWKLLKTYPFPAGISFGVFGNQTIEDKAGNLWIGASNAKLLRFDPVAETFQVVSYTHVLPSKGTSAETYALYFDRANTLWIGTQKGLVRARNLDTKPVFSLFKNSMTNRQSLSNNFILCLAHDPYQPNRYLWVGTKGGGLDRLDKQTGQFDHFTEAQGLPNKVVYGMLVDEFRNIWMSTNRGLAQFNPQTKTFHNYTKSDGLQDDEFNTGSYFKSASGELLLGGVNGLTIVRPRDFVGKSTDAPTAQLIGLSVNNERVTVVKPGSILPEAIEYTRAIDLNHDQNILTLEFGLVDYRNPAQNRYRYRLEGINEQWVEAGTNRFANYTHLPDGNYTLQMMGSADGEVWSKPVTLQIRVHPPIYRTWWAYLFYLIILLVVAVQLYKFQTQRLLLKQQVAFEQKEASRLAELDALKTQFFANISHEFRTPLTLISGPVEQMAREYADDWRFPILQQNAKRLLRLINQLLDLTKLEAGQLKPVPESGDLAGFLRLLASSFTSLAESQQINFTFTQSEPVYWASFDQDKIEKIVTNLLSNAFKFTSAGKTVSMQAEYQSGMAFLTIRDTGIGIKADKLPRIFDRFYQVDGNVNRSYEGTGIGLALVKELVLVLGGTITVDSAERVGTTFRAMLPATQIGQPVEELAGVTEQHSNHSVNQPAHPRSASSQPAADTISFPWAVSSQSITDGSVKADPLLLIIDDNADIRAYVRSIFEADFQILEAGDGQEGLEKATEQLPTIVICDLMMPRLDGFGFCRALKTQIATSHVPVVMLTAKATVEDRIEGFELGADEYLTKPFNQTEIRVRVRNLIRQRERLGLYFQEKLGLVAAPAPEQLIAKENDFLQKVQAIVDAHVTESGFEVENLSELLNLSQRQLVRKLKALTGQTAVEFIRNRRLELAATLIQQGGLTVSEVAYQVGFESLSYFTRSFQEKFGVLPSVYVGGLEKT
ncbi:response regulator [Spirosoma sp. HMF3257]|uniref:histidine kinase n=1 Tax=Spirosoma telluris TaxID=2183553 RepID=A0A327NDC8_9BACT|nr:response regulator [Spirosoma telluris]RAI73072.1 hybrid sensor histidine kinase/response regulator [Spirosoma telluris]